MIGLCGMMHTSFEAFFTHRRRDQLAAVLPVAKTRHGNRGGRGSARVRLRFSQAGPCRGIHDTGKHCFLAADGTPAHAEDRQARQSEFAGRASSAPKFRLRDPRARRSSDRPQAKGAVPALSLWKTLRAGKRTRTSRPGPESGSASVMVPPQDSTISLAIASPRPLPSGPLPSTR